MDNNFKDNIIIACICLCGIAAISFIFLIELLLAILLAFSIGLTIGDWLFGMYIANAIGFVILWQVIPNKIVISPKKEKTISLKKYSDEFDTWYD
jgi:hypothetical protein